MIQNSKILLIAVTSSLVLFLAGGFLLFRNLGGLAEEIGEIRSGILALDFELRNLKVFENFLASATSQMDVIKRGFISRGDLVRFIEDVERAGKESGLDVEVESASLASNPQELGPSFRLRSQGSFASLFRYMLFLENLPYEIVFEEISFSSGLSLKGKTLWNGAFIIRLVSYEF